MLIPPSSTLDLSRSHDRLRSSHRRTHVRPLCVTHCTTKHSVVDSRRKNKTVTKAKELKANGGRLLAPRGEPPPRHCAKSDPKSDPIAVAFVHTCSVRDMAAAQGVVCPVGMKASTSSILLSGCPPQTLAVSWTSCCPRIQQRGGSLRGRSVFFRLTQGQPVARVTKSWTRSCVLFEQFVICVALSFFLKVYFAHKNMAACPMHLLYMFGSEVKVVVVGVISLP